MKIYQFKPRLNECCYYLAIEDINENIKHNFITIKIDNKEYISLRDFIEFVINNPVNGIRNSIEANRSICVFIKAIKLDQLSRILPYFNYVNISALDDYIQITLIEVLENNS